MRRGRPPKGPKLVVDFDAPEEAKVRTEVILEVIAGELSIEEACRRLGVNASRFHEIRQEALGGMLAALAPRPRGRPPKQADAKDARIADLEAENAALRTSLQAEQLQTEIALTMPHVLLRKRANEGEKKGRRPKQGRTK